MSAVYRTTLSGTSHRITLKSAHELLFDDKEYTYELIRVRDGEYLLLLNGKVYVFHSVSSALPRAQSSGQEKTSSPDGREYVLSHRGIEYCARVEEERSWLLRSHLSKAHSTPTATLVRAPMPGLIVRIEVQPGQAVQSGQGLIVLEAMKMENEIRATTGGIVQLIHVKAGKPVEKGEPLLAISTA